mmetsp:Transcript_32689/g.56858  ORF Transcript_32689/g.56858 Transcript_32689/m.56858 type:complete len:351 (+) Transcript_32689:1769-2821(+)
MDKDLCVSSLERALFEKQQLQAELEHLCEKYAGVIDVPQLSIHVLEAKVQGKQTTRRLVRLVVENWQLETRQRQAEGYRSLVVWNESFLVPVKSPKGTLTVQVWSKEDVLMKMQGSITIQLKDYFDQQRRELWHSVGTLHLRLAIRVLHSRAVYYAQSLKKVLASVAQIERQILKGKSDKLVELKIAKLERELDPKFTVAEVFDAELVWEDWLKEKVIGKLIKRIGLRKLKVLAAKKCIQQALAAISAKNQAPSQFKSKALSRLSLSRQIKQDQSKETLEVRPSPQPPAEPPMLPPSVARRSSIAQSSDSDVFYDCPEGLSQSSSENSESGVQYIEDTPYGMYSRRAFKP